jgi:glycosyltransferase involved in cell wall biosynthesis
MPDISVVLPARNEAKLLPAALASIADQTFPADRIEAIVVSNGSTDGTDEVARTIGSELAANGGPRVTVLRSEAAGISLAKNLGVAAARGARLVFMDADSRMSPTLLATVEARASGGEEAASIRIVADGDDPIDHAFFWVIENGKRLVRTRANMFWCQRALFERLDGFDETLHHAEDLDLLLRARRSGVRVGHIHGEWIATSPRRLHRGPLRLGMFTMLGRWALGSAGIGRRWPYSGGGGEEDP